MTYVDLGYSNLLTKTTTVDFSSGINSANSEAVIGSGVVGYGQTSLFKLKPGEDIQSDNYVAGISGWKIYGSGAAEFQLIASHGYIKVYSQDAAPTGGTYYQGDLWYDTNDSNKRYMWNGTAWVSDIGLSNWSTLIDDDGHKPANDATVNATFFQSSIPVSLAIGDLWIDSDDNNKLYRAESVGADQITAGEWVVTADSSSLQAFITSVYTGDISGLQSQIDGQITTWFYAYVPTLINVPASDWTTDILKIAHLGDLFYNTATGYAYRFQVVATVYSWQKLSDSDIAAALLVASNAQDTADGKRRVFTATPTTPYDVGDLWLTSLTDLTGDLKKCIIAASSGVYNAAHWAIATKYTDDTVANQAISDAATAQGAANTAQTTADNKIQTYYQSAMPLTEYTDVPDNVIYNTYVGDMWYDTDTTQTWRYSKVVNGANFNYTFLEMTIPVSVFDTIDGKNTIFTATPTIPYYVGDMWLTSLTASTGDLKKCITERLTGVYTAADWVVATKYTDDTAANTAASNLSTLINNLGTVAYLDLVEAAQLGTTVIVGGYIKTSLIEAGTVVAGSVAAENITGTTISGKTITGSTLQTGTSGQNINITTTAIQLRNGSSVMGYWDQSGQGGDSYLYSNAVEANVISVNSYMLGDGYSNLTISANVVPYSARSRDLGSSSYMWNNVWTDAVQFSRSGYTTKYITLASSNNLEMNTGLYVGGTLSKSAGSFRIDHPLKPKTHYLQHSFVESPDMLNLYAGNGVLENGLCEILMPDWFIALNGEKDFTYQLTPYGQNSLYVEEEMNRDGRVVFAGIKDGKFSYLITAIRHDKYAEEHRIKIELKKTK